MQRHNRIAAGLSALALIVFVPLGVVSCSETPSQQAVETRFVDSLRKDGVVAGCEANWARNKPCTIVNNSTGQKISATSIIDLQEQMPKVGWKSTRAGQVGMISGIYIALVAFFFAVSNIFAFMFAPSKT
jgi:hypothetical protein